MNVGLRKKDGQRDLKPVKSGQVERAARVIKRVWSGSAVGWKDGEGER
jgi:hypothetical protein